MFSSKNLLRILINTGIGVILIIFWVKLVNINEVLLAIQKANLWMTLPFIACFMLSNLLRSLRLKLLLSEFKIPLKNVIFLNYLSQLLSFTIPLRVGEVTKGVYLSIEYPIVFSKALIWTFLDRFLDFWFILILSAVLLLFLPTNLPKTFPNYIFLSVVVISIGVIFLLIFPKTIKKFFSVIKNILIWEKFKKIFIKITDFFVDNIHFLNKGPKKTTILFILTILALISDGMSWYFILAAVLGPNLGFPKIFLGSLLASLTFLIPAAPGYVGSAEASALVVFSYGLGFDKTAVSAIAVLFHILTLSSILFFGLISLYFLKFNLNLVMKKFRKS